jgi:hypothetical protein
MNESLLIDEYHKKPYYVVEGDVHNKYAKRAEVDLCMRWNSNNISNKTKKHFGFILTSRLVYIGTPRLKYECRVEIHNIQKLFAFRLKHGL